MLALCAPACVIEEGDDIGSDELAVAVTWQNVVGATATGNSLTKTGGTGWNAGASSVETIAGGDLYAEFSTSEANTYKMAGLSAGDVDQGFGDIDFAIHMRGNATVQVYEQGKLKFTGGAYAAGDLFRVEVVSGVVRYRQNGVIIYTSVKVPTYPIGVDTSMYTTGATIDNVQLADFFWNVSAGVAINANDLTKTAGVGWGNSGAASSVSIAGDGYMEWTAAEANTNRMAGLSNGDSSQHFNDIDYAIYARYNGTVQTYEKGFLKSTHGSYATGDVFRVQVTGGVVTYHQNGVLLRTSAAAPTFPLLVDTALYTTGATINDVILSDTFWQNKVGVSSSGNDLSKTAAAGWGNAGASTSSSISADGYAEFTTAETNTYKMAGLSNGDANQNFAEIDNAIYLRGNGTVQVYENGFLRFTGGAYAAGDVFRVQLAAGVVTYYQNGAPIYTSLAAAPAFPLLVDTALYSTNATINDVVLATTP